jgi:hypothetical protein
VTPDRGGRDGPPGVVRRLPDFVFDRRSARQRAAATALLPAAVGALLLYAVLDRVLSAALGGFAGVLAALAVTALPLGALWAVARRGAATAAAWKSGLWLAFASALLYAWIFTGAWV